MESSRPIRFMEHIATKCLPNFVTFPLLRRQDNANQMTWQTSVEMCTILNVGGPQHSLSSYVMELNRRITLCIQLILLPNTDTQTLEKVSASKLSLYCQTIPVAYNWSHNGLARYISYGYSHWLKQRVHKLLMSGHSTSQPSHSLLRQCTVSANAYSTFKLSSAVLLLVKQLPRPIESESWAVYGNPLPYHNLVPRPSHPSVCRFSYCKRQMLE